jgi:hypothetical protein
MLVVVTRPDSPTFAGAHAPALQLSPLKASPTLQYNTPTLCPHCDGRDLDETAEHALLDCPAYAG